MKKKLLLHICCAPDATVGIEDLADDYDTVGFFYNPNIHPETEYEKRLDSTKSLAAAAGLPLEEGQYDDDRWFEAATGFEAEPEKGLRCDACFRIRIEETARTAREEDFEIIATVLTTSPHKDAEKINSIGQEIADAYGLEYLPTDLKKKNGFSRSVQLSRKYNLYRQNYCGCIFSKTRE